MESRRWNAAERAEFLRSVRLFSELPMPLLEGIAERFRTKKVARGEFVFFEGEPAETFNLVGEGRIKIIRETDDGREVILRLIGPGEIFGGAGGWGESHYPASARAQENSLILQLPSTDFTEILRSSPDFAVAIVRELGRRLREVEARIRDLQTERVERRIARVLLRIANKTGVRAPSGKGIELGVPLSRQDLAELAGTTLSTASRTLSMWDQQGIIAAGRERVTILEPHRLVVIAEDLPSPNE